MDPKLSEARLNPWRREQLGKVYRVLAGGRLEPLYRLELALGLRPSELLGLTWPSVNLTEGQLYIKHTLVRLNGAYTLRSRLKTADSQAAMSLPTIIADALRHQLERQGFERKAVEDDGKTWGNDWDLVFTTKFGAPLNGTTLYHHFQKLLQKAGLPPKRFYDLRHTSASLLFDAGADMLDVKEHLRHSQISLTANTYTHLFESRKRRNAEMMDAAMRQIMA